jgi:nucleoside-diphosphate-sugar epimerase
MRILVTGGTGALGAVLVRRAVAAGHAVASLSRRVPSREISGAKYLIGTFADPPWKEILAFHPECCVHLAWIATPGLYLESPENHDWVIWSESFLKQAVAGGIRGMVVAGTCVEYAVTGEVLVEDSSPVAPISVYARCKAQLHERLRPLLADEGVPLSWARIFYPYGETDDARRLGKSLVAQFREGKKCRLRFPRSIKDYVHSDDVADALIQLAVSAAGGVFNVGSGEGISVGDYARTIARMMGRPELGPDDRQEESDPLFSLVASVERLRNTGWTRKVSLEMGLQRLIDAPA